MSSFFNAHRTWNSAICHVLCDTVQIHCDDTIFDCIWLIWLKCQNRAFFLLNSTVIRISLSAVISCDFIFKFLMLSDVSLDPLDMSKNLNVIKLLNRFRSDLLCRFKLSLFTIIFCFQSVIHTEQLSLKSDWFIDCILSVFCLYAVCVWWWNTSNSGFHCLDSLAHSSFISRVGLKTYDIKSKFMPCVILWPLCVLMVLWELTDLNLWVQPVISETI